MSARSVTFDTNVFSHIVLPESCNDASLKKTCLAIRESIISGDIQPYISCTIFDLEGIERKDRRTYFGGYTAKIETVFSETDKSGVVSGTICISPNPEGRPPSNPVLSEKLAQARILGFRVLSIPRISMPRSPLLEVSDYGERTDEDMKAQHKRLSQALVFIDSIGAGMSVAKKIGNRYRTTEKVWYEALKNASKKDAKLAFGEWSDGDSVAGHISYQLDYFCTRDEAKDAGGASVFSPENRAKLIDKFGVKFVGPLELLETL